MNQSSYIAAFLLAGFVLWLAANNRLSAYAAVLWGSPQAPGSSSAGTTTGTTSQATPSMTSAIGSGVAQGVQTATNPIGAITNAIGSVVSLGDVASTVAGFFGL